MLISLGLNSLPGSCDHSSDHCLSLTQDSQSKSVNFDRKNPRPKALFIRRKMATIMVTLLKVVMILAIVMYSSTFEIVIQTMEAI